MKTPAWLILAILYVVWNLCAYLDRPIFGTNTVLIDRIYWFNERVFCVLVWVCVYEFMSQDWKHYRWVAKTFIWIAVIKTMYLGAIILGWIRPNDYVAVMAFIFIMALGYITRKWERLQNR